MQDDLEKVKDHTVILLVIFWESEVKAWDHWSQEAFWLQWDEHLSTTFQQKYKSHTSKKKKLITNML